MKKRWNRWRTDDWIVVTSGVLGALIGMGMIGSALMQ